VWALAIEAALSITGCELMVIDNERAHIKGAWSIVM